jgi:hypothetical protein
VISLHYDAGTKTMYLYPENKFSFTFVCRLGGLHVQYYRVFLEPMISHEP